MDYMYLVFFLLNDGKHMLKVMKTLWKNSLITAKNVRNIHVNFIIIAVTFSEEKMLEELLLYSPSYVY
jgi:hypothetical protein